MQVHRTFSVRTSPLSLRRERHHESKSRLEPAAQLMPRQLFTASVHRRLAVWLLVLTTVFGTLAPTLSHALVLARGGSDPMMAVCTSTGMSWAASTISADSPDEQESAPSLKSCPFCLLAADRVAPPPHAWVPHFALTGATEAPSIGRVSFFPEPLALTPPPRGPPDSF